MHAAILKAPEAGWKAYGIEHATEIRECAEVSFVPGEKSEHKDTQPLRYIAIRTRQQQENLFDDDSKVRHFAVLTNIGEWKAAWLRLAAEMLAARPKRMRFLSFNTAGRLVRHARRMGLRLATTAARLTDWLEAVRLLPIRVCGAWFLIDGFPEHFSAGGWTECV